MMVFALIFDGKVVQIEPVIFSVAPALEWINISTEVPVPKVGWLFNRGDFSAPPPPVRPPKSEAPLSAEELATELVRKGLVSRTEFDAIKTRR